MELWRGTLENLVRPSARFWSKKSVLITGHTGFKGGWLAAWLHHLGAKVSGLALAPDTQPNLFTQLGLSEMLTHRLGDIRESEPIQRTLAESGPEIVFHLAAQPLVRQSYRDPIETFATNVMGTANLLQAVRSSPSVKAVVIVTTDKCYENNEWVWPYREDDRLGGRDPYSSSKACTEIVTRSFRDSFLASRGVHVATARAGNVLGGGDWAVDRLIPDCVRASLRGETLVIRSPNATRPWQHVLEPLLGYLLLAEHLHTGSFAQFEAFNFGPSTHSIRTVAEVVVPVMEMLGGKVDFEVRAADLHEATSLSLDSSKAHARLDWRPSLTLKETIQWTTAWYRGVMDGTAALDITMEQIRSYQSMDRAA
jgi:CDP-glucose 4,6-dehydratase